jgi:uncharacterized membrane protein YeaQ/YmgE (transglycosylase-associated protein family)
VFAVIFWLVLAAGALVVYHYLRQFSGWASMMEVVLGILGAAAAVAGVRLWSPRAGQGPLAQATAAVAGALLLTYAARTFIPRRK